MDRISSHLRGVPPADLMRDARAAFGRPALIITDSQEAAVIPILMFDLHNCLAAQAHQPRGRGRRLDAAGLIAVLIVLQRAGVPLRSSNQSKAVLVLARWLNEGEPGGNTPWPPENEAAEDRDAKESDAMAAAGSRARSMLRRLTDLRGRRFPGLRLARRRSPNR